MTDALPKWEMRAYATLWNKYKSKEFNHEEVCKLLKKKKEVVSVLLSDIKKAGWVEVKLDPQDSRKRVYILKDPEKAINELSK